MRIHLDSPIEVLAFQSKTSAEYASKIFPNLKNFFSKRIKIHLLSNILS